MKPITDPENFQLLKAFVHGGIGALAAVCAIYNGVAYYRRREEHLLVNCGIYLGIVGLELEHVKQHLTTAHADTPVL